jgi:iron complex transport system ATP-binding protein
MTAASIALTDASVELGGRRLLGPIDLAFNAGQLTVVAGPNGAGKSTLLRLAAGLLRPARGEVLAGGQLVRRLGAMERARRMSYLPQNGDVAWPLSVSSVAMLGRIPHGGSEEAPRPADEAAVVRALASVSLLTLRERPVTELSGGERARALLARVLAGDAPILLCDEPLAALDPAHQLLVADVLASEARRGACVVAVMHDLQTAARVADRIVVLDAGRVVADGPAESVLTPTLLAEVFRLRASLDRNAEGLALRIAGRFGDGPASDA